VSSKFIIVVLVAVTLDACRSREVKSAGPPPPVPVSVAVATQSPFRGDPRHRHSRTLGYRAGKIADRRRAAAVRFVEGGDVKKGDLLFQIDPRPYLDALRQAEAAVARDRAQLRQPKRIKGKITRN